MAKLSNDAIAQELKEKGGYELVSADEYKNMSSPIYIRCPHGHLIQTTLAEFRKPSFTCPICDKNINFINPDDAPAKKNGVYRIIAFDQATENFGISIFDGSELVYYHLYRFSGDLNSRLYKIQKMVREIVINKWQPDFLIMEDIQYQANGLLTFKVLAMLLGIIQTEATAANLPFEVVSPNVWRKFAGTCGKTRREEKLLSVGVVQQKYGIKVVDDLAEAILIGRYAVMTRKNKGLDIENAF